MTKKQLIKELRAIAKSYKIRAYFYKNYDDGGYCHLAHRTISIGLKNYTLEDIAVIAFHEMGHILNKDNGKFPVYHSPRQWLRNLPTKEFMITAYRAEVYTEKVGRALMKKHMPWFKYSVSYDHTKKSKRWLSEYLQEAFGFEYV